MTEKSSDANPQGEEIHSHCIAHCWKCSVDTLVEQQRLKCKLCSSPLVYYCAKCYESFLFPEDVVNHVMKQLEQVSILFKCLKCYRSDFTTRCSLIEHGRNCNTPFSYNREIVVNLESCNHQSKLLNDLKPTMPLFQVETNQNQSEDIIKTENKCSSVYDDLEIGKKFKQPLKISSYCQEQTASIKVTNGKLLVNKEDDDENIEVENQCTTEKLGLSQDLKKYKCHFCKKSFFKAYKKIPNVICALRIHICDSCNYRFVPRDPNKNNCSKCGKNFSWWCDLKRHLKFCGQPEDIIRSHDRFTCDHCNFKTNRKSSLARHIQSEHLPRDPNANN